MTNTITKQDAPLRQAAASLEAYSRFLRPATRTQLRRVLSNEDVSRISQLLYRSYMADLEALKDC